MAPFDLSGLSPASLWLVFGLIGVAFGFVLEAAGFGDTRKLAGQFYLTEMTVLKVMFTAIVVAAVLIAGASAFGWLDMSRVWVNPTYLWPGIVGGLIMGVGFVVGGFCPGTSLVAAATLKLDGIFFVLGALVGVGLFGASVEQFEGWWLSSAFGRFTLADWLGVSTGLSLVAVVAMAVGAFAFAGWVERRGGHAAVGAPAEPPWMPKARAGAAALLLGAALVVALRGQPTADEKWAAVPEATKRALDERRVFVEPGEVVELRQNVAVRVDVIDLRDEHAFNLFHVGGARRVPPEALLGGRELKRLAEQPATTVTFLLGEGEDKARQVWQRLKAEGVANVYVVAGGAEGWLDAYPPPACVAARAPAELQRGGEAGPASPSAWRFAFAAGARVPSAWPEFGPGSGAHRLPCQGSADTGRDEAWAPRSFLRKVQLQTKTLVKGGCG